MKVTQMYLICSYSVDQLLSYQIKVDKNFTEITIREIRIEIITICRQYNTFSGCLTKFASS